MKSTATRAVSQSLLLPVLLTLMGGIALARGSVPVTAKQDCEPPCPKLTESQKNLAAGSRRAVLRTGMSEPYFDKHFRLVEVFDKPGDRRVIWKYRINEYEAIVSDSIGYYTEAAKRTDVHSVENTLLSTSDIKRTISRARSTESNAPLSWKIWRTVR